MGPPALFTSYRPDEVSLNCKIWEAARATSAAPTYFERMEINDRSYVDGGLGRNNPSREVLHEAKTLFGARKIGCLVSIGTGLARVIAIKEPWPHQKFIPTNVIPGLTGIATDPEDTHEAMLQLFANLPNTYFRLNVDQGMEDIQLSDWKKMRSVGVCTMEYMKKEEVRQDLDSLVNAITAPKGVISIEELGMEESLLFIRIVI